MIDALPDAGPEKVRVRATNIIVRVANAVLPESTRMPGPDKRHRPRLDRRRLVRLATVAILLALTKTRPAHPSCSGRAEVAIRLRRC